MSRAVFLAVALLGSSAVVAQGSTPHSNPVETFDEEALVRPLPDGKTVFVAHFRQSAPLASRHFEKFPKAMAQIARATRLAEAELSFTQGRWDDLRWGRAPIGTKPIGAELWASFHPPPQPTNATTAIDVNTEADNSWAKLTAHLGGFFCASLSRLTRSETVVAPTLAFRKWNGLATALSSNQPRRHGSLPSEAVCVENLTPWLMLLPCRDQAGVGSMLKSRTAVFGAHYVSISTKMETKLTADSKWDLVLTQTLTLVLEDSTKKEDGTTHLSSLLGIDKKGVTIENSCVAARLSRVHAESHAPFKVAGAGENMTDFFPKREHTAMAPIGGGVNALIRLQTWDLSGIGRRTTGRTGSTRSTRLTTGESGVIAAPAVFDLAFSEDKESALSGESYSKAPLLGYTPELTGERYLTGSGTRDGGLTVEVTRNLGTDVDGGRKSRDTKLRLFQPMPWYVRVFIHTLRVTYDGEVVELVSGTKSKSKSSKSSTANFVEGLSWSPSIDRKRPSVLEMQLAIPKDVAAVKIAVTYEKAFLYLNEFPPDANRGFDLPPAVLTFPPPRVIRFFRNLQGMDALESPLLDLMEGLVVGGNTASEQPELVYLNGLLITMPTPDFSMPFNVITMVCTLMSLLAGGVLAALTKRPSWDDFKAQKKTQGARLKALARSSNAVAKRGKGGKGDAKEEY